MALDPVTGSLLVAGGSAVAGGLTDIFSARSNRREAAKNRNFQREMYLYNNEYNTPLNQRLRLEAGGFNPHLMYGKGGISNTANMPNVPENPTNVQYNNPVQTFLQSRLMAEQVQSLKAQQNLNSVKAISEVIRQANIEADTSKKQYDLNYAQSIRDMSMEALAERVNSMRIGNENLKLSGEGISLKNLQTTKFIGQMDERFKNEMSLTRAKINNVLQSTQNLTEQEKAQQIANQIQELELQLNRQGRSLKDAYSDKSMQRLMDDLNLTDSHSGISKGIARAVLTMIQQVFK